jgi:hypothetical protein
MRLLFASLMGAAVAATDASVRASETDRCATDAEAAQASRVAGKLRAARAHVIACAAESCPRVIRSDCARWLTEIETELPTIVIRAYDGAGADLADVAVFVDGEKVADRVDGRPIPVDAGEHSLRLALRGGPARSRQLVVRSGEHGRMVSVPFESSEPSRPRATVGPVVLGGLGLGVFASGVLLWVVGRGEHADLRSTCAPSGSCATTDVESARTKLLVGDVAAAVGVLAVAGAMYWYFSSGGSASPSAAPRTAWLTF